MTASAVAPPTAPTWDLTSLYSGPDDLRLEAETRQAMTAADGFARRVRGRVGSLDAAGLADAITSYEAIDLLARRPGFFAGLLFAADTQDEAAKRLLDRTRAGYVEMATVLAFFEVELKEIAEDRFAALVGDPALAEARHWLETVRRRRRHTLSEAEEQVLARKNMTGREALSQLFDELTGSLRFPLDGRELTGEEALAQLYQPDPALRARAFTAFLDGHAAHGVVLTGIFNALLQDHAVECGLRRYPDVITPTHLDNEVRAETIEAMMQATERHYPLAQEYFRLKARLLGLERFSNADVYAPLQPTAVQVSFDDARALVLEAFTRFAPAFGTLAREFFEQRWIDAVVRPGKRLGAFCAALGPETNPWVLLSYTGTPRDVATLAHELGHGIHDRLAARQRPLDFHPPLTLAETASTFAEMVLTRTLLARESHVAVRREILCVKIEETIATVFRQNVLTRFEMAAHAARRDGPLSATRLGDLWWAENARLYGDAVEMLPAYRWGWSYIPHFIHSRFYCYSYVFGELLVLALYRQWQEEGDAFLPRYLTLLSNGGGTAPDVALRSFGVSIDDPAFWERGFAVLHGLLVELRATLDDA